MSIANMLCMNRKKSLLRTMLGSNTYRQVAFIGVSLALKNFKPQLVNLSLIDFAVSRIALGPRIF